MEGGTGRAVGSRVGFKITTKQDQYAIRHTVVTSDSVGNNNYLPIKSFIRSGGF